MARPASAARCIAIAVLVAACSAPAASPAPTPSGSPEPTEPPVAAPVTPAPATESPSAWARVDDPGDFPANPTTLSIVPYGDGFVAIVIPEYESGPASMIYRSPDGERWEAAEPLPEGDQVRPADLAAGPSLVVAAGTRENREVLGSGPVDAGGADGRLADVCASEPLDGTGASWWSADGTSWTASDGDDFVFAPIRAVASFAGGFVGVAGANTGSGDQSAAWISTDGKSWTGADDSPAFQEALMADVTADAASIVAVGGSECLSQRPFAWRSKDGSTWEVTELGDRGDAHLVAAGPAGFLATGWSGDDAAPGAAWLSGDGDSWMPAGAPPDGDLLRDLVGLPDRYLAVSDNGAVWSSANGMDWTPIFTPEDGSVDQVAVGESLAVALGHVRTDDPEQNPVAVWTAPLTALP